MRDHRINARVPAQRPEDAKLIAEHEAKLNVQARSAVPLLLVVVKRLRSALRANGAPNCEAMKESAAILEALGESID